MAKEKDPKSYRESIFEIRYKPNAKVLDHRGTWAEKISEHMGLHHWRILENRIDVHDEDSRNRCFVGFKNSGFVSHDSPTANYFPDKSVKFFKFVLSLDGFGSPLHVIRIGVRSKFYTEFKGKFEKLCHRYSTRFLELTDKASEIMNAKLIDIGGPMNFVDKHGNFNTLSGPLTKEQAKQTLERLVDVAEVGLYFDIDYWLKPEKVVTDSFILDSIQTFSNEAWNKHEKFCELILSD